MEEEEETVKAIAQETGVSVKQLRVWFAVTNAFKQTMTGRGLLQCAGAQAAASVPKQIRVIRAETSPGTRTIPVVRIKV